MISKSFIATLTWILIYLPSIAQQYKGGNIIINKLAPFSGNTYSVNVYLAVAFPATANKPFIHVNWGDGSAIDSLPFAGSNCTLYEATTLKYSGTHTFAPNGTYTVSVTDSFYVSNISNIPNSSTKKIVVHSLYKTTVFNNSPEFSICLTDSVPCCMTSYNSGTYDSDGDSLSFAIVAPQNIGNYIMPPATVDPVTGNLEFVNSVSGLVAVTLKITEWRKAVINGPTVIIGETFRELMFKVGPSTVGITDNGTSFSKYKMYPNPVAKYLTVDGSDFSKIPIKFSVCNLLGQELIEGILSVELENEIDVSFLENGIYIISLNNGTRVFSKKFIKN
jgi:hypothetical protein